MASLNVVSVLGLSVVKHHHRSGGVGFAHWITHGNNWIWIFVAAGAIVLLVAMIRRLSGNNREPTESIERRLKNHLVHDSTPADWYLYCDWLAENSPETLRVAIQRVQETQSEASGGGAPAQG
jgi:hypothetical protein